MTAKAVTAISKNRLVFISFSLPCGAYLGAIIPRLPLLRKRMIRALHLKAEIGRYRIGLRISDSPIYDFEISDLRCRNLPISKFALGTDIDRSHTSAYAHHTLANDTVNKALNRSSQ